ncbi:MAG: mechanosensitive ion channel family protein, partial [Myxococcota bacterium]
PFQNWTKVSKELLGTVFIHADYRIPVDAVRAELDRILEGNPAWDGRAKGVAVTDATERTVQLRPLVSAKDASELWSLRCEVREKLIAWLQSYEGGKYLPRVRLEGETTEETPHAGAV